MRAALQLALVSSLAVCLAVCIAGCFPPAMLEPNVRAHVAFDRFDGATAQQGRPIVVGLDDPAGIVDEASLAALTGGIALKTWPEATPVVTTTEVAPGPVSYERLIRVTPSEPLEDRWYLLSLADPPPGILAPPRLPDGTVGVRFRPGAHPRVARVEFCPNVDLGMRMTLAFSEPVATSGTPADVVGLRIGRLDSHCESSGSDANAFAVTCEDLTPDASVSVSVGPGITGASGVSLPPASWDIDVSALPSTTCKEFAPPI